MGDGLDRRFRSGRCEYRCQPVPIKLRCLPEPSQTLRSGRQVQSFQSFKHRNPVNGDTPRGAVGTEVKGDVLVGLKAFLTADSRSRGDSRELAVELAVVLAMGRQARGQWTGNTIPERTV